MITERASLIGSYSIESENQSWYSDFSHRLEEFLGTNIEDDAVSLGVRKFGLTISISLLLWLLSYILVMIQILDKGKFSRSDFALFIPMWLGSALGLGLVVYISIYVCKSATLVSRERRLFMRAQGVESARDFVDYDSLPLMRRLFCWNVVMMLSFFLAFITQILYYLWFVERLIGIWHVLVPLSFLIFGYLIYLYVMAIFSIKACLIFTFGVVQLFLFTSKMNHHLVNSTWSDLTVPLDTILITGYVHMGKIIYNTIIKYYILTPLQIFCLSSYSIALVLLTISQSIVLHEEMSENGFNSNAPCVIWVLVVPLITISSIGLFLSYCRKLANSRGYNSPIPLAYTKKGWVAAPGGKRRDSLLLGSIEIARPDLTYIGKYGSSSQHNPPSRNKFISHHSSPMKDIVDKSPVKESEIELSRLSFGGV